VIIEKTLAMDLEAFMLFAITAKRLIASVGYNYLKYSWRWVPWASRSHAAEVVYWTDSNNSQVEWSTCRPFSVTERSTSGMHIVSSSIQRIYIYTEAVMREAEIENMRNLIGGKAISNLLFQICGSQMIPHYVVIHSPHYSTLCSDDSR
jgi:hypothetical protein